MSGRIKKWTEEKITEMYAEGRGQGKGPHYKPWLDVKSISSRGNSRRVYSSKIGRTIQLLSDVEYDLFLLLEWDENIIDIREQYPIDREFSQEVARTLGIRHPFYPGTDVATVMTADFLCTRQEKGKLSQLAFNSKTTEEVEDENSLLKLEIQRACFESIETPHHLILNTDIPTKKVKNIEWIREGLIKTGEAEPRPNYWASLGQRMPHLFENSDQTTSLFAFCSTFDESFGLPGGTGLRVARMLMQQRIIRTNLNCITLADAPLSTFKMFHPSDYVRAVGDGK